MASNNIARMKKKNASRAGSVAGRASRYTTWVFFAVLAMMAIGIGLHYAGLLAPGMARFTYASE